MPHPIRPRRGELTLRNRWGLVSGPSICFVCGLATDRTQGFITAADCRDTHTKATHLWCWDLILKYAQIVLEKQQDGGAV